MGPTDRSPPVEVQAANQDQRLFTLFEIAKILATQDDLDAILSRCLSYLIEAWEIAETGMLFLYDPSVGQLTVRAAQGYNASPLSQIRVTPGEGMSGKAFQTGQTRLYRTPRAISEARANLTPTNRELLRAAVSGQKGPQSAVCIPLSTGQTTVGALVLESRYESGGFAHADLAFVKDIAQLVALSVERMSHTLCESHVEREAFVHEGRPGQEPQSVQNSEETNRLKAELISTLAHEMRTPLTSIKGYSTALLVEEVSFDPETQREFLQIIDEECDTLQALIHDLLESSIIDAGLLRLEPQPLMLHRLVQDMVDDLRRHTRKHRFLVDFPRDFPIVDADPSRIEQVLRNVIDNAVKYSPQGGMIVVRGQVQQAQVLISVADQGMGIAPEHLNRLFEKFFRVRSSMNHHIVGSGLGLSIARTIVESHRGRIWAESRLGEGSTFYLTLPLRGPGQ